MVSVLHNQKCIWCSEHFYRFLTHSQTSFSIFPLVVIFFFETSKSLHQPPFIIRATHSQECQTKRRASKQGNRHLSPWHSSVPFHYLCLPAIINQFPLASLSLIWQSLFLSLETVLYFSAPRLLTPNLWLPLLSHILPHFCMMGKNPVENFENWWCSNIWCLPKYVYVLSKTVLLKLIGKSKVRLIGTRLKKMLPMYFLGWNRKKEHSYASQMN